MSDKCKWRVRAARSQESKDVWRAQGKLEEWIKDMLDQRLEQLQQHHGGQDEIRAPVSGGLGVLGLPEPLWHFLRCVYQLCLRAAGPWHSAAPRGGAGIDSSWLMLLCLSAVTNSSAQLHSEFPHPWRTAGTQPDHTMWGCTLEEPQFMRDTCNTPAGCLFMSWLEGNWADMLSC